MVWVPDLALRPTFLGLGSGLPRAVPVRRGRRGARRGRPRACCSRSSCCCGLLAGGRRRGRAAGARTERSAGRAGWSRSRSTSGTRSWPSGCVIGHWPVLVGYAVLPWVIDAARTLAHRRAGCRSRLLVLVPLGSLSASAGLVTAVALAGVRPGPRRRTRAHARGCCSWRATRPGWSPGCCTPATRVTDAVGRRASSRCTARARCPAPLAALALGGIWNSRGRAGLAHRRARLGLARVRASGSSRSAGVAGGGDAARRDVSRLPRGAGPSAGAVAVLTWLAPDAHGLAGRRTCPASGCSATARALLVAVRAARGWSGRWRGAAPGRSCDRLPGAARAGGADRPRAAAPRADARRSPSASPAGSQPADYPGDLRRGPRRGRAAHDGGAGDVLVLPLTQLPAPAWNHGHKVLDPVGRYLPPDYVASDDAGRRRRARSPGEDPRARAAAAGAARRPRPSSGPRRWAALGIGFVVTDDGRRDGRPTVAGRSPARPTRPCGCSALDADAASRRPAGRDGSWRMAGRLDCCFAGGRRPRGAPWSRSRRRRVGDDESQTR